jgi:hypothetical protein
VIVSQHQLGDAGPRCTKCGRIFPCDAFRAEARVAMRDTEAREQHEQTRQQATAPRRP